MQQTLDSQYIYLDGEAERKHLIHAIMATRAELRQIIQQTPTHQQRRRVPDCKYTLVGLVAHLNFVDDMTFLVFRLARSHIRPAASRSALRGANRIAVAWISRQPMESLLKHMDANEERIVDTILTLPIDDFSKSVFDPRTGEFTTLEKAMQDFWLSHWLSHIDRWVRAAAL